MIAGLGPCADADAVVGSSPHGDGDGHGDAAAGVLGCAAIPFAGSIDTRGLRCRLRTP
jgi:hypothetical protein